MMSGVLLAVGWGVWSPYSSDIENVPSLQTKCTQWQLPSRWPVVGCRWRWTSCSAIWCHTSETRVETQIQRTYSVSKILPMWLVTTWHYASTVYAMALCPSVCVTSRCSTKTAKCRIMLTLPHSSPGTLVFLMTKISKKFDLGHPQQEHQMQVW